MSTATVSEVAVLYRFRVDCQRNLSLLVILQ